MNEITAAAAAAAVSAAVVLRSIEIQSILVTYLFSSVVFYARNTTGVVMVLLYGM